MREARFLDQEIMRLVGLSERDYRHALAHLSPGEVQHPLREDHAKTQKQRVPDQLIVRPLQKCTACMYVVCSCGKCHSEQCQQECLYETGEVAEPDWGEMSDHLREMLRNRLE